MRAAVSTAVEDKRASQHCKQRNCHRVVELAKLFAKLACLAGDGGLRREVVEDNRSEEKEVEVDHKQLLRGRGRGRVMVSRGRPQAAPEG